MRRVLLSALIIASMICTAVAVIAQSAPDPQSAPEQSPQARHTTYAGRHGMNRYMRLAYLQKRLNLTPQQIDQIKEIHYGERLQAFDRATAAANEREALLKAVLADNADPTEIKKRKAAVEQAQTASLNQFITTMEAMGKVLTPEQRAEFVKMLDEHSQKRSERRAQLREKLTTPKPQQ